MAESSVVKAVSLAALLAIGIFVVSQIYAAQPASTSYSVENETVTGLTGPPGDWSALTHSEISEDAETLQVAAVYFGNNGTLAPADHYNVNSSAPNYAINATAEWNTSATTQANVSYSFDNKPEMARNAIGDIGSAFQLAAIIPLVLFAVVVLVRIRSIG